MPSSQIRASLSALLILLRVDLDGRGQGGRDTTPSFQTGRSIHGRTFSVSYPVDPFGLAVSHRVRGSSVFHFLASRGGQSSQRGQSRRLLGRLLWKCGFGESLRHRLSIHHLLPPFRGDHGILLRRHSPNLELHAQSLGK